MMKPRLIAVPVLCLVLLAGHLLAQDTHIDGLHVGAAGTVNAGYSGDFNPQSGSDHAVSIGGDATVHGYYYNPNFISFDVSPYYGRSQANSGTGSIFNSSGYNANFSIFSGSHFPGSVSINQGFNNSGTYGIPGVSGLTTETSSRNFAVGWSVLLPDKPTLSLGFTQSSGSSEVEGSDAKSAGNVKSFSAHSAYHLAGFPLSISYNHIDSHTDTTGFLSNVGGETKSNFLTFSTGHSIPRGRVNFSYSRGSYSNDSPSGTDKGSTNTVDLAASSRVWRIPLTVTADYTDNAFGSLEQQTLANGGTYLISSSEPTTRALNISTGTSYMFFGKVFVNAYLVRQEEWLGGSSYGLTQYGATGAYNFGKRFKGLVVTVGAMDTANAYGNTGATLLANAHYNRYINKWDFSANLGYNQNVQTLFALYTMSSFNYSASASRKLQHGMHFSIGGGGSRSGFQEQAGDMSHAESVTAAFGWRRFQMATNYSQSSGQSVLTSSGLVALPSPVITGSDVVVFDGKGEGASISAAPIRNMNVTVSYSRSIGSIGGQTINSNTLSELYNGFLTYRLRKLYFNAGVTKFRQDVTGSGSFASQQTSYYFGISRWFKFF